MDEDLIPNPADVAHMAQQKVDETQQPVNVGHLTTAAVQLQNRLDSVAYGTTAWLTEAQRRSLDAIHTYIRACWGGLFGQIPGPYLAAPTVSPPTHEFIANPTYLNVVNDKVTEWIDRPVPTNKMTSTSWTVAPASATYPMGVRKGTTEVMATNTFHFAKQTIFLVYTFPVAPAVGVCICGTRGQGSTAPNHMWTRSDNSLGPNWLMFGTSGQNFKLPPNVDTELNKPYVMGITWDFTLNPPRFAVVLNGQIVDNDSNATRIAPQVQAHAGLDGITLSPVTGLVAAYQAPCAQNNTAAGTNLTIMGRLGMTTNAADAIVHYVATWENRTMSLEELYASYHRLAERYTHRTVSMGEPNVGINDEFEDLAPPTEGMDTSP